jgi:hypothetical protein
MLIVNCIRAREVNADTELTRGISATPIGIGERPSPISLFFDHARGDSFPIERRGDRLRRPSRLPPPN